MFKTILATLILATFSSIASADYIARVPLMASQGGPLADGSIVFITPPPAPTFVSTSNICEDSAAYTASSLFVTQTRNYTRTCKDVDVYSDSSTVDRNVIVNNISVVGTRPHLPYFTTVVNYRLSSATFSDIGVNKLYQLTTATGILSTQHKSLFKQLWLRGNNFTQPDLTVVNTMQYFTFIMSGDRTSYQNSIKAINLTTATNVKDNAGNTVSCRSDNIFFSYSAGTGNTKIDCIFNNTVLDANTHFNSSTIGSIQFVLAD
jgi:hypothetical protein